MTIIQSYRKSVERKTLLKAFKIKKSTFYHWISKMDQDNSEQDLIDEIKVIIEKYPFYGYRRVHQKLLKLGHSINHKKVYRIYCNLNLQLPVKKRRKKKYTDCTSKIPLPAAPNQQWALDFQFDSDIYGRKIKILNIIDNFSKKVLISYGARSIGSEKLVQIIIDLVLAYGKPKEFVTDNGPEFRSKNVFKLTELLRSKHFFIQPGKPWQNGFVESYNSRFRQEFLNRNLFSNLGDFNRKSSEYVNFFNRERVHSSLKLFSPDEVFGKSA